MNPELYCLGAEPVDLNAVMMLWKSPWWAKVLESMEDFTLNEDTFITILGRIYRDCAKKRVSKITMAEFADLASMARKVRWKNVNSCGFGPKHRGLMKKKLQCLRWNPEIARFEFEISLTNSFRHPGPDWKSKRCKRAHKAERALERLEREKRVSEMLKESL